MLKSFPKSFSFLGLIFSLVILLLPACIPGSRTPTQQELDLQNRKKLGIRNTIFSSALLLTYQETATSQSTEFDFSSVEDKYPFSENELRQMLEAKEALDKEGLLTPEAKHASVLATAISINTPEVKPSQKNEKIDDLDLGLPPLPLTETNQEAVSRKQKFEILRDNYFRKLSTDLKTISDIELTNLRENLILSVMVAEQQKEYIYMLPTADKDFLLESASNSVQLRILVINEMERRGINR